MEFRILGPLEVVDGERALALGGPKQRGVLAQLLLAANRVASAERLIEEIWGDDAPESAISSLHSYVSRLRQTLIGGARIEWQPPGYVLRVDPGDVDALRFEQGIGEGRRLLAVDAEAASVRFAEALALWRGRPLPGVPGESAAAEALRLEELRLAAIEERATIELALGRESGVIGEVEAILAEDPLRERLWAVLMHALYRSGRQAEALDAYHRARKMLAEELGLEPSPELEQLQGQILRHDPRLQQRGLPLRGYQLLERIGAGMFGVVHRAIQPHVGREVALKAIHPRLAHDPEFIRRFELEAQLVARLEHPRIVPLYDYWRDEHGAFLVMRWLRGGSLATRLRAGPYDAHAAAALFDQLAAGLAMAHRNGVIHRDLKPANILLDEDGAAYLSDFGIAKELASPALISSSEKSSSSYLSPEELRGEPVTAKADIYGLGVVLYESLVGQPPPAVGAASPRPPSGGPALPAAVEEVLATAMATDPADRYPDVETMAAAVRTALSGSRRVWVRASLPVRNPYKGLHAFAEADAPDFFGREALVARLLARLAEPAPGARLLAVVGPSGSGKSSVVKAGLLPALRRGALPGSDRWFIADMFPGAQPMHELAEALRRVARDPPPGLAGMLREGDASALLRAVDAILPEDQSELLLVVDQLEELFTLGAPEAVQAHLLESFDAAVTSAGSRLRIIATLRADFYDRPLRFGSVAELLGQRTQVVAPLSAVELERAIARPAERAGVTVEPALATEMVGQVLDQPGALPLLEYALTELFECRTGEGLTRETLLTIGGISGAIARRAEELYGALDAAGTEAARQVFLRLVSLTDGAEETRRRVLRRELASLEIDASAVEQVLESFGRHRLLSFDRDPVTRGPTVEVAHEALLREWGRLRVWLEAAREDLFTHRRVAAAAAEWDAAARDPSLLARGAQLERVESWASSSGLALAAVEREFLDASLRQREAEMSAETARRGREAALERRAVRRLRGLVAVLTAGVLVAAGLAFFAAGQGQRAEREARSATARELAAAAVANLETDPDLAILLALAGADATLEPDGVVLREAEEALRRAVHESRVVHTLPALFGAAFSRDGERLVTADGEGNLTVWQVATGAELLTFRAHDEIVIQVEFTPDGAQLATTSVDGTAKLSDAQTGETLRTFAGHGAPVFSMNLSPDGSLMVTRASDGTVRVWDVATGETLQILHHSDPRGVHVSSDGTRVAVGDGRARIWDLRSGEELLALGATTVDVRFNPAGTHLATADRDGNVRIWNLETHEEELTLIGHSSSVEAVDWSPDGSLVASGSHDGTVRVWEARSGRSLMVLGGVGSGVEHLSFSPDGRLLVGAGTSGSIKLWDITPQGRRELRTLVGGPGPASALRHSPDGAHLVSLDGDGTARIWHLAGGQEHRSLAGPARFVDVQFSTDGAQLVTAASDGRMQLWDATSGEAVGAIGERGARLHAAALSPDGMWAVAVADDGLGHIWSVETGERIATLSGHTEAIFDVDVNADGSLIATVSRDETTRVWEAPSGELVQTLSGHENNTEAVSFSPDGSLLVVGGLDGLATVWEVGSWQLRHALAAHAGGVTDVAFDDRGQRLATASLDGTAKLWDPASGQELLTLPSHAAGAVAVTFSPDGEYVAVAGEDGAIRLYVLDIGALIDLARDRVTRAMTNEECVRYLHIQQCET